MGQYRAKGVAGAVSRIHLVPHGDELLSTYVVRLAHCNGLSPHRFATRFLPGLPIWTSDIDVSLSSRMLGIVARQLHLDEAVVRSMTVYGLMGCESTSDESWMYIRRWVNSVGIYHRLRRRFGLQYCPICLADEPVFQTEWRLSFVFVCSLHAIPLRDCCLSCRTPVMPHRAKVDVLRCWRCGASLCAAPMHWSGSSALLLQEQLVQYARSEQVTVGAERVPRAQFFHGATYILRMMKAHMHSHPSLWPFGGTTEAIQDEVRRLRVSARLSVFSVLVHILGDWPANFLQFAITAGATQLEFERIGKAPEWLAAAICLLPKQLRLRRASSEESFVHHIRRLESRNGIRCRAERAQMLMLAARGNYEH